MDKQPQSFDSPLRGKSLQEKRRHLIVLQLSRIPQFREMVRRLDSGRSDWSVTEWLMEQPNRGSLSGCTFGTARRYIGILHEHMRAMADKVPRRNLDGFRQAAFQERLTTLSNAAILNQPEPKPGDVEKLLADELAAIDAISILKHCALIQKERLAQVRKLETTSNIVFPYADKTVDVLRRIGSSLWQLEAGQALLHSKNAWPITNMGEPSRVIDLLPEVKEIAGLDPVDQNLIREALNKTFDLLEDEAKIGQYAPRPVETKPGGTEAPEGSGS